jgi:MOSC domain-containing protein YiiM
MHSIQIVSIQVGKPRSLGIAGAADPMDRPWTSGFYKQPVTGPVRAGKLGLAGDGQADLENHGGVDKAILGYSAEHYPAWHAELEIAELTFGAFGENLTIGGLTERDLCIGDLWEAGDVQLQVSQPRQPCWKLARRWRRKDLPKRVIRTGRSGWYFRVLQAGFLEAGMPMRCVQRLHPEWSVARASQVLYAKGTAPSDVAALRCLAELADGWKSSLPAQLA